MKDVTKKYAGHWLMCARRLRLNEQWWTDVLQPYALKNAEMDDSENQHITGMVSRTTVYQVCLDLPVVCQRFPLVTAGTILLLYQHYSAS